MSEPVPSDSETTDNTVSDVSGLQKDLQTIMAEQEQPKLSITKATLKDALQFDEQLPYGPKDFHEYMYGRMQKGEVILLLAKDGEKPVGRMVLELGGPSGPRMEPEVTEAFANIPEITGAEIAEEYRGRGIGTEMIRALEDEAEALGFEKACIGAATNNPKAKALYERLGYKDYNKPRHKLLEQNGEVHEAVYLEKTL